uniref:Uncharacterized protein n=1 Tax=Anopheles dirus TaxID=7168 RepID=A0A182NXP4_9DIPT
MVDLCSRKLHKSQIVVLLCIDNVHDSGCRLTSGR